jgi:hypothetical protein
LIRISDPIAYLRSGNNSTLHAVQIDRHNDLSKYTHAAERKGRKVSAAQEAPQFTGMNTANDTTRAQRHAMDIGDCAVSCCDHNRWRRDWLDIALIASAWTPDRLLLYSVLRQMIGNKYPSDVALHHRGPFHVENRKN